MPLRVSEAFILRTYALKESDKIVSFFTRDQGKCRGVARGARRPKSKFGSTLEPLSEVKVQYFERERSELSSLDHCDLVASMTGCVAGDLLDSVAVALMVEVADRMLPDHEPSDAVFRLLRAVCDGLRASPPGAAWLPLSYYLYWMVRLGGFLPEFGGSPEAATLAAGIARQPLADLIAAGGEVAAAGPPGLELRSKLKASLEDHLESSLKSWTMLGHLPGPC